MPDRRRASAFPAPPGAPIPGRLDARAVLGRAVIDAEFLRDPYPTYRVLREAAPLVWSDEFFGGAWLVTRHADVELVLRDARFSAQRTGGWVMQPADAAHAGRSGLQGFQRLFARAMIFLDAPDHTRVRQVMSAAFRPADLQRLVPRIERAVAERLSAVDAGAPFDFVGVLARPLPAQVIAWLMGLDDAEGAVSADVVAWSDELAHFVGAPAPNHAQALSAQTALLAMARYFDGLLARRRAALTRGAEPCDDLIGRLLQAERDGQIRGSAELLAQCVMLLFAGHETTRHLLANGLRTLLSHPEQWRQLQRDRALLPGAVRELLRFDSPVQYTGRRVTTDLVLHGQALRRGDLLVALIGAANRDPARHERPNELDITRRPAPPLAFGQGPHVCIGAALTLMEAQAVFAQLLERWPDLALTPGAPTHWTGNALYRGLNELSLQCSALMAATPAEAPTLPPSPTARSSEPACKP
ncbi:MAG: biofilm PGA synthesis protein PgaC [Burkholderiales bacterium PBB1]|nr:MAG: biofilm PGA synthesis protein PgaC [Burkholderiales bacterium PBB1]